MLIPVLLSYTGVSPKAAGARLQVDAGRACGARPWAGVACLERLTERALGARRGRRGGGAGAGGFEPGTGLKIGDLDAGAPELRRDSRYNLDNAYITAQLRAVERPVRGDREDAQERLRRYEGLVEADRLGWELEHVEGVKAVPRSPTRSRQVAAGRARATSSGTPSRATGACWGTPRSSVIQDMPDAMNPNCSVLPVDRVPGGPPGRHAGPRAEGGGDVRRHAQPARPAVPARRRLGRHRGGDQHRRAQAVLHHAAVLYARWSLLCFITFRSWRAVLVAAAAAGADLDPVRGDDGGDGHRREGRDAAGDRARRRHRRRLRAVPAVGPARTASARGGSLPEAYRIARSSPARSSRWSASRWPPASSPGPGRRSSSRPTWGSCSRSCSCGTCSARWS